jgi:hypothetical protein
MSALGDALGEGPEPEAASLTAECDLYSCPVSPALRIVLDASCCVVLVVSDPSTGDMLRRVTVTDVAALKSAADNMLAMQARETERADKARYSGPDEKRRAEGKLTRSEAVDWLIANAGIDRRSALAVTDSLRHSAVTYRAVDGMGYDGRYWTIPV